MVWMKRRVLPLIIPHADGVGAVEDPPFPVVAIAASAGGLPALQTVLRAFPDGLPAAIVIVQHRSPVHGDRLTPILQRSSRLPIKIAQEGETLRAGTVYLAPADRHVVISAERSLGFRNGKRISFVLSAADPLFESLARNVGKRAIAVVLTGSGRNGAAGVRFVKDAGGTVLAQDAATCEHFAMPSAAIATGAVDQVLPIEEIGPTIVGLITEPASTPERPRPARGPFRPRPPSREPRP